MSEGNNMSNGVAKQPLNYTPQQIQQLAEVLFPLFLDTMEKHIEDTISSLLDKRREEEEKKIQRQISQLQISTNKCESALKGHKQQMSVWTNKVTSLQKHVNETDKERKREAKQIKIGCNKLEEFTSTHTKMKNSLKCIDKIKANITSNSDNSEDIDNKIEIVKKEFKDAIKTLQESSKPVNGEVLVNVENSQDFINAKYEELKKDVKNQNEAIKHHLSEHDGQLRRMANRVEKNHDKSENNSQYLKRDCLVLEGVPETNEEEDSNHNEKCKTKVLSIFKELKLIVDPDKISILHRLKKSKHSKAGPRGIIVKFTSREVCHDVFLLRKACKEKTSWAFDRQAKRIFLNEALTPEKRKLMYETKTAINKHLVQKHGIIYVWSYHGNIFIRKNAERAPKIMIRSSCDLYNVIKGFTSLDEGPQLVQPQHDENNVRPPWWFNMSEFPPMPKY